MTRRERTRARALDAAPAQGDAAPDATSFGPSATQNPAAAAHGFATQHGDSAASDTSPLSGPGTRTVAVQHIDLLAACPSILMASDGLAMAVCTQLTNQTPAVYLLEPTTGRTLATRALTPGNLFGGVYPYLDNQDRLVVVDGERTLLHIAHAQAGPDWTLNVERTLSLASAVHDGCSGSACDGVVGLAPGYDGRIWFATAGGKVGVVDKAGQIQVLMLPDGERIANSIATAPEGTAVVSDHALYLFSVDEHGRPQLRSRAAYDRGPARKPGQLSYGSGSTPTFFGPRTGSELLTITDNADPVTHLLVFHASDLTQPVCELSLPAPAGDGSENSPIGSGRSVFVASTYGYPYPALPAGEQASVPSSAPVLGGMTRVDVSPDLQTCAVVWQNQVHSAAVPKLSLADRLIYTVERKLWLASGMASALDSFAYTVIDPESGAVAFQQVLPNTADTLQLAGTLAQGRVLYQGTITGILRIEAAR
ncbi:MAG: hypothetical protein JWN48_3942 [Myxococcaceae bacterium]|nr:hypothetical protein [Myxococcaceae bacterium]